MPLRRPVQLLAFAVSALSTHGQTSVPVSRPVRPIPAVAHVVIISVDGLRPDKALQANMPALRGMLRDGAYTFWARTTAMAITLPSHTSMLTGVTPAKHGIYWNDDLPFSQPVYPKVPTVLEMATRVGCVTAMVAGKSKFSTLIQPGAITYTWVPSGTNTKDDNDSVLVHAVRIIEENKPDLIFIHFPDCDTVGHAKGWGSAEYLAQVEKTDTQLAAVLAALDRAQLRASSIVILTADHGGQGLTHGPDDERSRNIPWIITGPGVRKGFDLTSFAALTVHTEDTCATACWLLGLPQQPYFDGKPVDEAFVHQ